MSYVTSRERHYIAAKVSIAAMAYLRFLSQIESEYPPKLPLLFKYGHFWLQKNQDVDGYNAKLEASSGDSGSKPKSHITAGLRLMVILVTFLATANALFTK